MQANVFWIAVVMLAVVASAGCGKTPAQGPAPQPAPPPVQWSRVIVLMRLPAVGSDAQRSAAIVSAREALLKELASVPYRLVRAYEAIPAVTLDVSPEALRLLQQSPLVEGVQPDIPVPPAVQP